MPSKDEINNNAANDNKLKEYRINKLENVTMAKREDDQKIAVTVYLS